MATVTRENIGVLNDKITVKIAKEDYLSSFEKSLKNYSKQASIPGFRKGMVPAGIIKKMHGQSVFTDEVLKTVEKELTNFMAAEKLDIFAQPLPLPENDARQIDVNNPNEYAFSFEVGLKPAFSIADLSKEKVKNYVVEITDDMVNQELERLQMRHGKMTEPEAVSSDDQALNVTFLETDEAGNELEGGIKKENSLLVKYFSPALRQELQGKKKDKFLQIQLDKAFEGKEKDWVVGDLGITAEEASSKFFKLLITKVGFVEKAELNEELFKAAYPGKDIADEEALKNVIREEIKTHWERQGSNHLQHEIYHILLEHSDIPFPEDFLKRWMENGTEKQKTPEEVEKEFPEFANQLKWSLINDRIGSEQNIEVGPDDIKEFAKQQLFGYMGMNTIDAEQPWIAEYINKMMQDKKFIDDSYHRIRTEKIFKWAEAYVGKEDMPISAEDFNKILQEHQHHQH